MHDIVNFVIDILVNFINQVGYLGIFIGMFLESTLVPIPSEIIMIPAGIAAAKGLMNIYIILLAGISGNILGAGFSYYLAKSIGRAILLKIGKYFFVRESTIVKIENYFRDHGPISVFIGRLLPGFRHFISLPAGVAKMNIKTFYLYTAIGSTIWTTILTYLGYLVGEHQDLINKYLHELVIGTVILCAVLLAGYIIYKKKANRSVL